MSNSNFSKMFKEIIGKSYKQFLTDARIAEAKRQLIASNKTITDIAYSIGFSSSSHFISTFKQLTKTTPLQYRNKYIIK